MTASERIRQARRAQLIAQFERDGWPLAVVRMLLDPNVTLSSAVEAFDRKEA